MVQGERPDQVIRKWEEMKDMKKAEGAIVKLFAKLERKGPTRPLKKKGKKK